MDSIESRRDDKKSVLKLSPDEGLFINKIYSKSCPQILSYIIYWKIAIVLRLLLAMLVQNLKFKQYQMFHSDNIIFQIDSRNMSWLFLEWVWVPGQNWSEKVQVPGQNWGRKTETWQTFLGMNISEDACRTSQTHKMCKKSNF